MKLSIIIVNYNVKFFLEQCLYSVQKASANIECEIFVVDNNSVDGSRFMIRSKFPDIILIENKSNLGFSKANNQAIRLSKGDYILLLNPDTIVEEDTFHKIIGFMEAHPEAGGLGVKMIDGKGRFLPESKRSLPMPVVAFYKIFGLSALFPKSKKFNKYHLGYLNRDEVHEIEVLSGACMLLRRTALDKTGLLDEDFFMYGEDIDISYRLIQHGYKNYYFPHTAIIHYKGESTKKSSINYVLFFYNAMIIFARKHFSPKNARIFSALIHIAVYFRASLALSIRIIKGILFPVIDALIIFLGYILIKPYWEQFKFPEGGGYPREFLLFVVPVYIIIWILALMFSGAYQKPVKFPRQLKGIIIGTIIILIIYALLSEELRFSRALILLGAVWAIVSTIFIRILLHLTNIKYFRLNLGIRKKIVIVGSHDEAERIQNILKKSELKYELAGFVSYIPNCEAKNSAYSDANRINCDERSRIIGNIDQLSDIVKINKVNEIIFCAQDIPAQKIIKNMLLLSDIEVDYKIASPDSISIIGSNSINTSGDLYIVNINSIAKEINKRNKRLLDIILAVFFLASYPFIVFFIKSPYGFLKNILKVLTGLRSWVGYCTIEGTSFDNLPGIKTGILNPLDRPNKKTVSPEFCDRINILYAKDYKLLNDLLIIYRGFKELGREIESE
ncbi:MAG: glycosyltransferase [Bacteroidia bacterium]|nr:glycosyltransferase [Bacteroidia bacterium]